MKPSPLCLRGFDVRCSRNNQGGRFYARWLESTQGGYVLNGAGDDHPAALRALAADLRSVADAVEEYADRAAALDHAPPRTALKAV